MAPEQVALTYFLDAAFWTALAKIMGVNIVLSGDNAVVIALVARSLPAAQQRRAVIWGAGAAILLRVALGAFAAALLALPGLKLVGGALLLWIGVKLLMPEGGEGREVHAADNLWVAVRTILLADVVMSLDNVVAVAAAAGGDIVLLAIGLALSIPLVVFGATFMVRLMERWPVIVTGGAGLLGFVAGEMAWQDTVIGPFTAGYPSAAQYAAACAGALIVIGLGRALGAREPARKLEEARPHDPAR